MSPEVVTTASEFRAACDRVRAQGQRVGLVPTMGALHAGHRSLMAEAARHADVVAVTIFVNPTQFGPDEDLERYPRDLPGDLVACEAEGVAMVFAPGSLELYPPGEQTRVRVEGLGHGLCGMSRPVHFEGVATVVTKLLALAGPCVAVFGRKDYQQLKVIERLARDLMLPAEIIGGPIVREPDGLALSSRNRYLSPDDRERALAIPRALSSAVRRFAAGERSARGLRDAAFAALGASALRVDYVSVVDADTLATPPKDALGERALLAVAAQVGPTRLIDNVVLGEDPDPTDRG